MAVKRLPKFVESELEYSYMTKVVTDDNGNEITVPEKIVYKFPRLRKRDAESDAAERRHGNGYKANPAVRLSEIVEDIYGWEDYGFESRGPDESESVFRQRIVTFFSPEDMQEYAEHALLARSSGVFPNHIFRGSADRSLPVVDVRPVGGSRVGLSDLFAPGQGSPE